MQKYVFGYLVLMLTRTLSHYVQFNDTARENTKSRVRKKYTKVSERSA